MTVLCSFVDHVPLRKLLLLYLTPETFLSRIDRTIFTKNMLKFPGRTCFLAAKVPCAARHCAQTSVGQLQYSSLRSHGNRIRYLHLPLVRSLNSDWFRDHSKLISKTGANKAWSQKYAAFARKNKPGSHTYMGLWSIGFFHRKHYLGRRKSASTSPCRRKRPAWARETQLYLAVWPILSPRDSHVAGEYFGLSCALCLLSRHKPLL